MVFEYCENGELFSYLKQAGRFPEDISRFYFHQLISAIEYMHNEGYAHRDIKLCNIVLDKEFDLKLCDFGFAVELYENGKLKELNDFVGTHP